MSPLRERYRALLASPAALAPCRAAPTWPALLDALRVALDAQDLDDVALVAAVSACNREPLDAAPAGWLPYAWRGSTLRWCAPDGRPTEPFFDQHVDRLLQAVPLNQLVQPRTRADAPADAPRVRPAGLILHLSRAGSTLLAGACAEVDAVCSLSEAPVLTDAVLDPGLAPHLPRLLDLHAAAFSGRPPVVKLNAWDLLAWPAMRRLWPDAPVVLLVRHPVEILASHARAPGRHMAGDPALAALDPALGARPDDAPIDLRVRALGVLLDAARPAAADPRVRVIDYAGLVDGLDGALAHLGVHPTPAERAAIEARLQRHAKDPTAPFVPDAEARRAAFPAEVRRTIEARLLPGYRALVGGTGG